LLNPQDLSIERNSREWSDLLDNVMIYGLMGIAFCLFFVRLNHIVEYGFFVLLVVWILWQLKNGTLKWVRTPLDIPIFLFVAWALLCVPFAVDPAYSFDEWRKAVSQILLFYFIVQTVKTKQEIHSVFLASVLGMVALCFIESVYFLGQGRSMWDMSYRAGELTGSSQWFSMYLVIGFPMLLIGLFTSKDCPRWSRMLFGFGLGISLLGLLLVHTRGAWVAIGIQLFLYVFLKRSKNCWMVMGGAGILVGVLLVLLSLPNIQRDLTEVSKFTSARSMQVFKENLGGNNVFQ